MLLGLVLPTSGEGTLLGHRLGDPETRRRIGFLPERFAFQPWLTARELLTLHADLGQVPRAVARRRIPELLAQVALAADADRPLRTYSKGMLQRAGLAQALVGAPELLLLDEPTSGLDPGGRLLVRNLIARLRAEGTTALINSHLLGEIESTCDRVILIREGIVVHEAKLGALTSEGCVVRIRASLRPGSSPEMWQGVYDELSPWCEQVQPDGDGMVLHGVRDEDLPAIHRYLSGRVDVYEVAARKPSLEDLFVRVIGTEAH
jgi:ABC-2 type transport system ATP-binding protein